MKKKILYFVGHTTMAGSTISFKIITDCLADNYEMIVVISDKNVNLDFVNYLKSLGIFVEYFKSESSIYPTIRAHKIFYDFFLYPYKLWKKIRNVYASKREIKHIIEKHKPDLIHTNIGILYQVISVANRLGIPHVLHIREYQTKDFGWKIFPSKRYYQAQLRKSHVISITKDIAAYFKLHDHKNACVIYDGILSENSIVFNSLKEKYFLCASRISEEKGIESAINAFDLVASQLPDYSLVIAGGHASKDYENKINVLINSKKCSDRIKMLGYRNDAVELMRNATALIVGSRFEGLGRMTVEATFSGCLVVGRNSGGTKEVLELTQGGFLFDTESELSEHLTHIATMNNSTYHSMIKLAQKKAVENFSNEVFCQKVIEKYNDMIKT